MACLEFGPTTPAQPHGLPQYGAPRSCSGRRALAYQPIENYGIIGNMRTAALVGMNRSIDCFCYPNSDSPTVLGKILDDGRGGRCEIARRDGTVATKQFYSPETNVLVTRFLSSEGVGQITDFMPVGRRRATSHTTG